MVLFATRLKVLYDQLSLAIVTSAASPPVTISQRRKHIAEISV